MEKEIRTDQLGTQRPVFEGSKEYSSEPEIENAIGNLWYWFGEVTKRVGEKRVTFPMRKERADIYKNEVDEVRSLPKGSEGRLVFHERMNRRAKIEREFLDQMDIEVETPWSHKEENGEVVHLKAKYTILNRDAKGEQPPIVVIPGASNGMESMDSFIRELAFRMPDRKIYLLGYPDAPSGLMTPEFYKAVKENWSFGPHAVLFEETIKQLIPEGDFEAGYFSAGGGIGELILARGEFKDRITKAWFLNPFGNYPVTEGDFAKGLAHENNIFLKFLKDIPRYVFVNDRNKLIPGSQKWLKFNTWVELGKKCGRNALEGTLGRMRIKDGGEIKVISGREDVVSNASKVFNDETQPELQKKQPNLRTKVIEGSYHAGPFIEPDKYIDAIVE